MHNATSRIVFTAFILHALTCPLTAFAGWPNDPAMNLPVSILASEQATPAMTSDGSGGAIIVWEDFRNGVTSDIYAQRVDANGAVHWTTDGIALCTAQEFQNSPAITPDGAGGAILAWTDYRSGSADVYVQRVDGNGNALWTTGGMPICDDNEAQLGVEIVGDGAGGAIVVWEDFRSNAAGDLYAQRVNASGIPQWTFNGVVLSAAAGGQIGPVLMADGFGGAIVAWRDQRASGSGDIYAQRLNGAGAPVWTADGVPVCTASGGQFDARIVPGPNGGAIIAWSDDRAFSADIYAQFMSAGGTATWTANGVVVCDAPVFQFSPMMVSDAVSGAIITWEDFRSDTTVEIYAQRVNSNGDMLWPDDGAAICTLPSTKSVPNLAPDGSGGAVIVWQDQRSLSGPSASPGHASEYDVETFRAMRGQQRARARAAAPTNANFVPGDDVYGQRILANGQVVWTTDGVAISSATDIQGSPVLVSDGAGGAVVSWYDSRAGNGDVYAQNVTSSGTLGGGTVGILPPGGPAALQLASPWPNPATRQTTLRFTLPEAADVQLRVYDASGRAVRTLADGMRAAGSHQASFDLRDDGGRRLPAGLYFARLTSAGRAVTTRLVALP